MKSFLILTILIFGTIAPSMGQSSSYIEYVSDVINGQQSFYSGGQPQVPSTYVHATCIPNQFVGGTSYDVQVSTSVDFSTGVITQSGTNTISFYFQYLCPETTYYTRTKLSAESTYGVAKEFYSNVMSATKANKIRYSSNGSNVYETITPSSIPLVGIDISIRVDPMPNATNYIIELSKDITFTTGVIMKSATSNTNWGALYFQGLDSCSQYFVRATYEGGDCNLVVGNANWGRITSFITPNCTNGPLNLLNCQDALISPITPGGDNPAPGETHSYVFNYKFGRWVTAGCGIIRWTFKGITEYTTGSDIGVIINDPDTYNFIESVQPPSEPNPNDTLTVTFGYPSNGYAVIEMNSVQCGVAGYCGPKLDTLTFDFCNSLEYTGIIGIDHICEVGEQEYIVENLNNVYPLCLDTIIWSFSNSNWLISPDPFYDVSCTIQPTNSASYGGELKAHVIYTNGHTYDLTKLVSFTRPNPPSNLHTSQIIICRTDNSVPFQIAPSSTASDYDWEVIDNTGLVTLTNGGIPAQTLDNVNSTQVFVDLNGVLSNQVILRVRANYNDANGSFCGRSAWITTSIDITRVQAPTSINVSGSVCNGGLLLSIDPVLNATSYDWIVSYGGGNNYSYPSQVNPELLYQGAHADNITVTVNGTSACGTGPIYVETISLNKIPSTVDVQFPSVYCENETATFCVNNPEPGIYYDWNILSVIPFSTPSIQTLQSQINAQDGQNCVDMYFQNSGQTTIYLEVTAIGCNGQLTSQLYTETIDPISTNNPSCNGGSSQRIGTNTDNQNNRIIEESFFVNLSPNPSSDLINIEISGFKKGKNIKVVNTHGSVVFESSILGDTSTLDLSTLNKGIYFIKVTDGVHQKTEKIILQ